MVSSDVQSRCTAIVRPTGFPSRSGRIFSRGSGFAVGNQLADQAEAVARVQGTSVNALIVDSLAAEIERVRADKDFTARAKALIARDKELLDRLEK